MTDSQDATRSQIDNVLRILRRRWLVLVVCAVVSPASALALSLTQEKKYSASAGLLFRDAALDQKLFGSTVFSPSNDADREAATNVRLVSLKAVAARTSRALGGRFTPDEVSDKIAVEQQGQSDVVSITATDPRPPLAANLANAFARQYISFRRDADRSKITGAQGLVQAQLARLTPEERNGAEGRSLRDQAEQLNLLASLQTGNAEFVERAEVPGAPSTPKTRRNVVLGFLLGGLLGVGLALLLDRLDRRLKDVRELEDIYDLPVLAAVPDSPSLAKNVQQGALPFAEAEAFRMLRARLRYFNVDRPMRSVLVTSVGPGEGKSTIAWNLACVAARMDTSRVLFLEADLRRSKVARRYGLRPVPGLAEMLTHDVGLDQALQRIDVSDGAEAASRAGRPAVLDVVAGGADPPNPSELIESEKMAGLLDRLIAAYDMVVIDTPPTAVVSDAIPLISRVSGVIVVSQIGSSSRPAAAHLADELRRLKAHTLGVVANRLSGRGEGYYGYYRNSPGYGRQLGKPASDEPTPNGEVKDGAGGMPAAAQASPSLPVAAPQGEEAGSAGTDRTAPPAPQAGSSSTALREEDTHPSAGNGAARVPAGATSPDGAGASPPDGGPPPARGSRSRPGLVRLGRRLERFRARVR